MMPACGASRFTDGKPPARSASSKPRFPRRQQPSARASRMPRRGTSRRRRATSGANSSQQAPDLCRAQGYSQLKQLTVANLRTFRNGRPYSALSAVKRVEYLRNVPRCRKDANVLSYRAAALPEELLDHHAARRLEHAPCDLEAMVQAWQFETTYRRHERAGPRL